MRHVFTTREKVLLVILAVLVIAVGYWKLILTPINDSIADLNAQTASEQDAILTNSARLSRMRQMQQELETLLADPDAKPLPDYDNSERLLVELNTILSGTVDYTLSFGSTYLLEDGGSIICRPISLEYTCGSYTAARGVMDALHGSDYVNLISDVTLDLDAQHGTKVNLTITYFELQSTGSAS